MKDYRTDALRNIALLGHQGSGKTSLAESLLYVSGVVNKKGEVEKKNTKSDFLIEEQTRGTSMQTSLIPVEWNDCKLNFLDVPGNDELVGELYHALEVVKGAVILIDATKGVEVGTEAVWREIRKRHIPAVLFINKMDKENINYEKLLEDIREKLGKKAVPFTYPIGRKEDFEGFVNVVEMKARIYNGVECVDAEIWEEKMPKVAALNEMIMESVAETSEELLEKYLGGEKLSIEEVKKALHDNIINGELTPVLVGSVTKNIGVQTLLKMLIDFAPSPDELKPLEALNVETNQHETIKTVSSNPFSGFVFKTMVDPFIGTISFIKINSGTLKVGDEVYHERTQSLMKINTLMTLIGKDQIPITEAFAGDIVVTTKLDNLRTDDTLSTVKQKLRFEKVILPTPVIYKALHPHDKNDEDKISMALSRLNVEDPSFDLVRNKETGQLLIGGYGLSHISYIAERMKSLFKVGVDFEDQKIVYRETIKKKGEGEGKHKKQSGGAGQYGHVKITFEPSEMDFEFHENVFGGAVPKSYFPAVEKGLIKTFEKGPLAGFPVIKVKSTLFDGSYHDVDSNEISFVLAADLAFKNALDKVQPTILEPILKLSISVKEAYVGDVMGDLNKRRGRILGMDQLDGFTIITAEVPEAEVVSYAIDLKAMTQGSGRFEREFIRYDEVPQHLQPKIIEQYKK
ncbi:elongation factor G [Acholeplasma hippikon]|uniref:Elongation factor G domain protein n=1 Tax=Acholeplasma hippikon TaxID=264636 RepID=A0A449BJU1_9MOLU|nr:elongation factor G [Acholeplasma hippikon]VEU82736.1 Elongation factor G domain protein [Acholeplasma hippikon]